MTDILPSAEDLTAVTGKPLRNSVAWLSHLAEVESHVASHGRLPRVHNGGRAEGRLYGWLKYQRDTPAHGACLAILDERVPCWDAPRKGGGGFTSRVHDLKVYRDACGVWPSLRSRDKDVLSLAKWLSQRRWFLRTGTLAPDRKALLDEQVPGWDETVQETWERTAREIATFREYHGRMPSGVVTEHSERRLSRWIDDMRRGRGLSPERKAFLDEVLPGWDITRQTSGLKQYQGAAA
jgi:hypothetical protein